MRVHSTQRHTCPVCPKKFGALFDLNDHVRSKHPELPDAILKQIALEFKAGFGKWQEAGKPDRTANFRFCDAYNFLGIFPNKL